MIGLMLLGACGPGSLEFQGAERLLRSAWILEESSSGEALLLLSNNALPCRLSQTDDPTEILLETQEISHARSRERSLLLWATLDPESAPGHQVVSLHGYEVTEAERMWTDGLIANYRPIETVDYLTAAELQIDSRSNSHWTGSLTALDPMVEAHFRADLCQSEEVFQILGLIGID